MLFSICFGYFHVVRIYNARQVFCETVTSFDDVSVKNSDEFTCFKEMMVVFHFMKAFCDVIGHVSAKHRIEPIDILSFVASVWPMYFNQAELHLLFIRALSYSSFDLLKIFRFS